MADAHGYTVLPETATEIASDLEYRLRELVQASHDAVHSCVLCFDCFTDFGLSAYDRSRTSLRATLSQCPLAEFMFFNSSWAWHGTAFSRFRRICLHTFSLPRTDDEG